MDLIVNQVMQLQVVHIAYRDLAGELFTGTAIIQGGLAVVGQIDLGEVDDMAFLAHQSVQVGRVLGRVFAVPLLAGLGEAVAQVGLVRTSKTGVWTFQQCLAT